MIQNNEELIVGVKYMIPCLVGKIDISTEEDTWRDKKKYRKISYPVYNNFHSDYESGQKEKHYHIDFRFVSDLYKVDSRIRLDENFINKNNLYLTYRNKTCFNKNHSLITSSKVIENTKLKHKCITKGKCPHRGMDLSQEIPVNEIITCPLHGLKFNSETKQLIL